MVSFSNGCVSDDTANKRPLENGYVPKYKPRKVSAIRDFPPRCGRSDVHMIINLEQNGALVDVDMSEQMDASAEIKSPGIQLPKEDVVNNPLEVETVESLDELVGKVMTTTAMDGSLNDDEELVIETEITSVDELDEIKNSSKETSIGWKDKYCRRRVSAIRDFPPHCGRHVSLQMNSSVKVKVDSEPSISKHGLEGGARGEMTMTSDKECLDETSKDRVKKETTQTLDDGGRGLLGLVRMAEEINEGGFMDSEECYTQAVPGIEDLGKPPLGRENAVCSPNTNDEVQTPRSGFSTRNELCREIVHGLMASSNCPWRNKRATFNNSDSRTGGLKIRKQNLSRQKKFKAVDEKSNYKEDLSWGQSLEKDIFPGFHHPDGSPGSRTFKDEEDNCASDARVPLITPISMVPPAIDDANDSLGKEIVVYSPGQSDETRDPQDVSSSVDEEMERVVARGLQAAQNHPSWKGQTVSCNPDGKVSREEKGKQKVTWRRNAKAVARKSTPKAKFTGSSSMKHNKIHIQNDEDESPSMLVAEGDEADDHDGNFLTNSHGKRKVMDIEVSLPPFGSKSSGNGDARNRVRETLRMFNAFCRKLLQQEESNSVQVEERKSSSKKAKRIDLLSAKMIKEIGKEVNTGKQYLGEVPGVEVGDEFQYRVELAVIGIHRLYQAGIDWMKLNGKQVATSIVSSGAYDDDVENADVLIYSGQGGNIVGKSKKPEDQKLERGNLALKNSISAKTPVRVIRGWKEARVLDPLDPKPKMVATYVYDGLYTVESFWPKEGPHGNKVFMFELRRIPGQQELAWKELKKANKFKSRPGMVVNDISGGKEPFPIFGVNTLDDQKPPPFNYINKMMYPKWFKPKPPSGCDCTGRCSDSKKCQCAVRNGGEIPYNRNGAIVETKPLVYECGPHCRCPPSCYNRVTQRGIRFQLEIFKTDSRGWGVRALTSIPSGSFICEYAGELLEDKEAEQRIGNDEYLFDIGQNYSDTAVMPNEKAALVELMEAGYTIDAAQYGNVGRFINHSCSPNLYAQNVIYDHDDKKMPHVMLFAMENIPPLQELTYHYNYSVDQICDSNGNIKVKKCYCGSAECTGRMY